MQKPMELTKTQQRHTLSAKKKKQQPTLKNILAQPFPRYWPQIDAVESKELFSLLNDVRTKNPEYFARKKSDAPHPIAYGLSSTLRRLKVGRVRLLVLSADLKPRYVINQIILLALARNEAIRILCVPNLEEEIKQVVDFQCFAFALVDTHSFEFHKLFDWCQILTTERYPVPPLISAYFDARRRRSSENEAIPMETEPASIRCGPCDETPLSDLHLTRSNTAGDQRAFIPKNAIDFKPLSFEVTSLDKIKSDFISLDAFDSDGNSSKNPPSPWFMPTKLEPGETWGKKYARALDMMEGGQRYLPATIKRYTGNPGKKKNDGKGKLNSAQRKEMKKQLKMAKKNK